MYTMSGSPPFDPPIVHSSYATLAFYYRSFASRLIFLETNGHAQNA
jgi:hypothetical protein